MSSFSLIKVPNIFGRPDTCKNLVFVNLFRREIQDVMAMGNTVIISFVTLLRHDPRKIAPVGLHWKRLCISQLLSRQTNWYKLNSCFAMDVFKGFWVVTFFSVVMLLTSLLRIYLLNPSPSNKPRCQFCFCCDDRFFQWRAGNAPLRLDCEGRQIRTNRLGKFSSRATRLCGDEARHQLLDYRDLLNWTGRNSKEQRQRLNQQ